MARPLSLELVHLEDSQQETLLAIYKLLHKTREVEILAYGLKIAIRLTLLGPAGREQSRSLTVRVEITGQLICQTMERLMQRIAILAKLSS